VPGATTSFEGAIVVARLEIGWGCNKKVQFDTIVGALSVARRKNNFFPAMVGSVGICKSRAPVQGLLAAFRCKNYWTESEDNDFVQHGLHIRFLVIALDDSERLLLYGCNLVSESLSFVLSALDLR
jgi:hypothetical protein